MPVSLKKQQGVVLIIGLIFLVLLTLMAVTALNLGKADFMATANMQMRKESVRAAEQVIDEVIANTSIDLTAGTNIFGTGTNVRTIDINGQGATVTVTVAAPVCKQVAPIMNSSLDFNKPDDLGCSRQVEQGSLGIEGANQGDSLCSETVWEVNATATEALRSTRVKLVQGLSQRLATNLVASQCN